MGCGPTQSVSEAHAPTANQINQKQAPKAKGVPL